MKSRLRVIGTLLTALVVIMSCTEEEDSSVRQYPTLEKPIEIKNGINVETYLGLETHFYVPESVEDIKNRPIIYAFAPSPGSHRNMLSNLIPIADEFGLILACPVRSGLELDVLLYSSLLDSIVLTSYVDKSNVYLSGYSNGAHWASYLSLFYSKNIKGTLLIASSGYEFEVKPDSPTVCVCSGTEDTRHSVIKRQVQLFLEKGARIMLAEVEGYDHWDMLSKPYTRQKIDCYNFLNEE